MSFSIDWQTAISLGIVALSFLTLLKVYAKSFRNAPKVGCGNCPNNLSPVKAKQLVSISTDGMLKRNS